MFSSGALSIYSSKNITYSVPKWYTDLEFLNDIMALFENNYIQNMHLM